MIDLPAGTVDAVELARTVAVDLVGIAVLAGLVAVLAAVGYRWYTTRAVPVGVAVVLGSGVLVSWLLTRAIRTESVLGQFPLSHPASAGYVLGSVVLVGLVTTVGRRLGDELACAVFDIERLEASGRPASLVRSARVTVVVELPETIADVDGYEPVDDAIKRDLAGESVRLPHSLSDEERRERLRRRIERDYGVGYVDVALGPDGSVEHVGVGQRPAGIGPMLPSESVAVAVRGDPSPKASAGDPVEIWTADEPSRLVTTGTLLATNEGSATVVVDANAFDAIAADEQYRLVTCPDEPTDGNAFVSALRVADETVTTVTVDDDGPLAGEFVGWLPVRTLVLAREDDLLAFPDDRETLAAGDRLWVLGTPAQLRDLDAYEPDGSNADPVDAAHSDGETADTESAAPTAP